MSRGARRGCYRFARPRAKCGSTGPRADDTLPATGEFRRALQVLVNLIGNAVRYSPAGGMVWIRAERDGDMRMRDRRRSGQGHRADDQARIFEKFGRVDPSEPGGSGLGLYIARRLARAMGGDITVDSAPGQGARFVFTLARGLISGGRGVRESPRPARPPRASPRA